MRRGIIGKSKSKLSTILAVGSEGSSPYLKVYDINDWSLKTVQIPSFPEKNYRVTAIDFNDYNEDVLIGRWGGSKHTQIFDVNSWNFLLSIVNTNTQTWSGKFFDSGNKLVTLEGDNSTALRFYNTSDYSSLSLLSENLGAANYGRVEFNPSESVLAVAHSNSPYLTLYDTSTWLKMTGPSTKPSNGCEGICFNHGGSIMAVTSQSGLFIYNTNDWSLISGTPTITNPGGGIAFNNNDTKMAVGLTSTPYVKVYNTSDWSLDTAPDILPTGRVYFIDFDASSNLLACGHSNSPYISVYNTSNWSKISNPSSLPTGQVRAVKFY